MLVELKIVQKCLSNISFLINVWHQTFDKQETMYFIKLHYSKYLWYCNTRKHTLSIEDKELLSADGSLITADKHPARYCHMETDSCHLPPTVRTGTGLHSYNEKEFVFHQWLLNKLTEHICTILEKSSAPSQLERNQFKTLFRSEVMPLLKMNI